MNRTARMLSEYADNGVISLNSLKRRKFALFRLLSNNLESLSEALLYEYGIEVLNDTRTRRSPEHVRLFLKWKYGLTVNLSRLKKEDPTIYNYIKSFGKVSDFIKDNGFRAEYDSTWTDKDIVDELYKHSPDGTLKSVPSGIYRKVYSRAKRANLTVREYITELGFRFIELDKDDIEQLRQAGHSYREISKLVGYSPYKVFMTHKGSDDDVSSGESNS